ncbi:MAG: DUF188 domain-containing protein [Spirochaetaceae bacterium]|nr:DUF188 domain-containing protein [Spirochaetaceae bacterium]
MKVLVDADSLPKQIRAIVIKAAIKRNLNITFVSDRYLKDIESAYNKHTALLRNIAKEIGISEKEELNKIKSPIEQIVVETGENSADDKLVELAEEGDLSITHDIPLSDRLVEKGVIVLDDRGSIFTENNIKTRLSLRNSMTELRSYGVNLEKNSSMKDKDIKAFADAFSSTLDKKMREN